jgi:hypothetical protein
MQSLDNLVRTGQGINELIAQDYLTSKPIIVMCSKEDTASTDDASGDSRADNRSVANMQPLWLQRRAELAEQRDQINKQSLASLKSNIQNMNSRQVDWQKQTQQDQYINHAYSKLGESEATRSAALRALQKMVKLYPHDHEFVHVVVEPVTRFGIKRFEKYLQDDFDCLNQDENSLAVIEDYKQVFEEIQSGEHSFGPKNLRNPVIILPADEYAHDRDTIVRIAESNDASARKFIPHKSKIVSEDLNLEKKKHNYLPVPSRGLSVPGTPNTDTEKSALDLHRRPDAFLAHGKQNFRGTPSSLNSKKGLTNLSKPQNPIKTNTKYRAGKFTSGSAGDLATQQKSSPISRLQPPCLAPLSMLTFLAKPKKPASSGIQFSHASTKSPPKSTHPPHQQFQQTKQQCSAPKPSVAIPGKGHTAEQAGARGAAPRRMAEESLGGWAVRTRSKQTHSRH